MTETDLSLKQVQIPMRRLVFTVFDSPAAASYFQGHRWVFKSGTAIGRHRRSASAEGAGCERAREGELGVLGISPEKNFKIKMSVEAILMHFETNFAC